MRAVVPNLVLAGLLLAALEVVWVLLRAGTLFLSLGERLLYVLASCASGASCVLLLGSALWFCGQSGRTAKLARGLWSASWATLAAYLLWSLSEGRRVKDLASRPYVVTVLALLLGAAAWGLPAFVEDLRARGGQRARTLLPLGCLLAAGGMLAADALILPRSYPAFHLGLALMAVLTGSLAGLLLPARLAPPQLGRALVGSAVLVLSAPLALSRLATHPTAGFAVRETAPWSAQLTRVLTPSRRTSASQAATAVPRATPSSSAQRGVDLRDRDILLITVDALRADLLRAYGGTGKTPELDRLAAQSAVFMRAYTPAPHTSYALASLLTGKFVKPLVELGGKLGDPPSLPDRLRRYGYRTAAFYPPAIFFVDGASFEPLQKRGFGFEYRKEMFASAPERVAQLAAYLEQADPKKPLFAWVHLFEPHEPYDAPQGVAHDGSERGRYEAEVSVCDRAIAELVQHFRAVRPGATVIITADHGEEFGDHGGSFHGTSLYDEQVRIPLLWSSPGVVMPRRIEAPVELTDVGTTILSTAAIPRDAHMRGDELGGLLAGHGEGAPRFAFASIAAQHMVSDGRLKLICAGNEEQCALFDLLADPSELHNLAGARAADAQRLRRELDAFLGSIAREEAVTVTEGVRLPEALARARLAGSTSLDELLRLLSDSRAAVRLEAAHALGELGASGAAPLLDRARQHDDDPLVRCEAAISELALGDAAALHDVLALLSPQQHRDAAVSDLARERRAALALARFERVEAVPVLAAWLRDESATESERLRAVRALGELGSPDGVEPLIVALGFVRLRESAAHALGRLGGDRARAALRRQLHEERYPPARAAEVAALQALRDPSLPGELRRLLGMESSLPNGVRTLATLDGLSPSDRRGALLSDAQVRKGSWRCIDSAPGGATADSAGAQIESAAPASPPGLGCAPLSAARVVLPRRGPALRGPVRVTVWYRARESGSALVVDGERFPLQAREDQLSFVRSTPAEAEGFSFESEGAPLLLGLLVSPALPEIPPPPPEPWDVDAGVSEDAGVVNAPLR
ncbi:MAG: hypothetical protein JWN48_4009 [Myxococcaceae bacterium]|nr:hypothetical protein [Myxococcaceae bacterium]